MDFDLSNHNYGPFSVKGVLWYIKSVYDAWASPATQSLLSLIGTIVVARVVINIGSFLLATWHPTTIQKYCHAEQGSWVLITGATGGIGYAFAEAFCDRGFNVLIHGRNPSKLAKAQAELSSKYPRRKIETVVADASAPDDTAYLAVAEAARALPGKLTILVNNIGGVTVSPIYTRFEDRTANDADTILNLNVRFLDHLTRELLPLLRANTPGLVLNCSSLAGAGAAPYVVQYAGTKAYVSAVTRNLKAEFDALDPASSIEVMGFLIGPVMTQGNTISTPLVTTTARQCVDGCLAKVGNGKALNFANWKVALLDAVMKSVMPQSWWDKGTANEMTRRKLIEEKGE